MVTLITIIHVVVSIFLIIVVLLQSGKSADIAGTFSGMGSQTAFGPRGAATVLSRATTIGIVIFMMTSISLSIFVSRSSGRGGSVLKDVKTTQSAPASPATTPAQPQPAPAQPKK